MYWHSKYSDKINRYYKNTYIKIPECATLVNVYEVGGSYVRMKDVNGNIYEVVMGNGYNLEWTMPVNRIYFQHGANAYCLARHPAKQYQRGFSDNNTLLYKLTVNGEFAPQPIKWDILNSVVNKLPYTSIDTALYKFKNESVQSVALTHRIAMVKNGLLCVDLVAVGFYNVKKKAIVCLPAYAPIFYDFLKANGNPSLIKIESKHEEF